MYRRSQASSSTANEWQDQRGFVMETLGNLAQTMDTQMRHQAELAAAISERNNTSTITYEKFLKLNPPTFSGKADPELAESWITETERVFRVLSVPEDKQTDFGTYRLTEDAQKWWDTTRTIHFAGLILFHGKISNEHF